MSCITDVFSLDADETVFNMNDNLWLTHVDTNNTASAPFHEPSTSSNNELAENNNYSYWRPCTALCRILNYLTNDDFAQFPCIPCSYCSRLIYPHSTKWIIRDETIRYPFELSFPETSLTSHPNNSTKIAVCSGCKSHPDGWLSRKLAPIPTCIKDVPYAKRKYLSPV